MDKVKEIKLNVKLVMPTPSIKQYVEKIRSTLNFFCYSKNLPNQRVNFSYNASIILQFIIDTKTKFIKKMEFTHNCNLITSLKKK